MAFIHGKDTQVLLDGKNISAWLNAADLNVEVEAAEATTFSKSWKVFHPGMASSIFESGGFYDTDMINIPTALETRVDSVLSWMPGIIAHGDPVRMMAALHSTYKESAAVGGMSLFSWTVTGDDTLGIGHNLHPLAAETTTANGTAYPPSGGAQTLLGAVGHLHVTAVAGSGPPTLTVKFQDATTFGGAYTDITGGAFTVTSAVGAQRLVIPGTIRQYVRAIWTITGGSPSFTFAVAFARKQ
jgi:hypothetical protein